MSLKVREIKRESFLPPLWAISLAAALLFGWLLIELKEIVVLLVVGYCVAYILDPLLCRLEKWQIRRTVGVLVVLIGALVLLVVAGLTAVPTIGREYARLAEKLPHYIDTARERIEPLTRTVMDYVYLNTESGKPVWEYLDSISGDTVEGIVSGIADALLQGYSITLTIINLALLPFIVFYLSVDFHSLHRHALRLFPVQRRARVASIAGEMNFYVSSFIRGQILVGLILAVLYAIGLRVVGVELWFLLAVISGFGNMIPYLGLIVGIVLSSIMALVTFGDFSHVWQVWLVYIVVQVLEGNFITPRVLGGKVGLSPLVVILAILAGGKMFGLLGIFLAVPGAAILRVLFDHAHAWAIERM